MESVPEGSGNLVTPMYGTSARALSPMPSKLQHSLRWDARNEIKSSVVNKIERIEYYTNLVNNIESWIIQSMSEVTAGLNGTGTRNL
jgi:hypothetical protein